ncbi:MAG: hypothetical protein KAS32_29585 [Candidatus Peribacteraceae bacterium]|nr:hypothetical protein [Candidatus Peribacteraceae bacterium]
MKLAITENCAWELARVEKDKFLGGMRKKGYILTPIPEFGNPCQELLEFFYREVREKYAII